MVRVSEQKRAELESFWRGHHEGWQASDLNQREYCELHGLPLKRFGNWRAQFKDEEIVAKAKLLWRRGGGLRHMSSHMSDRDFEQVSTGYVPMARSAPDRRRNFRLDDKKRIVAEAMAPGASISAVARRYGIDRPLLFRWKRELTPEAEPVFVPVTISDRPGEVELTLPVEVARAVPQIEVELAGGQRVRFMQDLEPERVRALIAVLEGSAS